MIQQDEKSTHAESVMPEERRLNEEKKSKPTGYVKDVLENLDCVFRKSVVRCTTQNLTSAGERIKNLVI